MKQYVSTEMSSSSQRKGQDVRGYSHQYRMKQSTGAGDISSHCNTLPRGNNCDGSLSSQEGQRRRSSPISPGKLKKE